MPWQGGGPEARLSSLSGRGQAGRAPFYRERSRASELVNPLGTVLASVRIGGAPKAAVADLDLSQRFREAWLRDIASKERRAGPYQYQLP